MTARLQSAHEHVWPAWHAIVCLLQGTDHRHHHKQHKQSHPQPTLFRSSTQPRAAWCLSAPCEIRTCRCSAHASLNTFPHARSHAHSRSDLHSIAHTSDHCMCKPAHFPACVLTSAGLHDPSPHAHTGSCTRKRTHTGMHMSSSANPQVWPASSDH